MTKYQNAVMWLGLALIFVRFLTTGQRSLLHNLLTVGGNQNLPPSNSGGNTQPNPQPNAPAKPKPKGAASTLPRITVPIPPGVAAPKLQSHPQPNPRPNIMGL